MENLIITLDLVKVRGVTLLKTADGKEFYGIPIDELFLTERNAIMKMVAVSIDDERFGKSHILKRYVDTEKYKEMSELEKRMQPIIGSVRVWRKIPEPTSGIQDAEVTM